MQMAVLVVTVRKPISSRIVNTIAVEGTVRVYG